MELGPEDVSLLERYPTIEASHRISLSGNTRCTCTKHEVRSKISVYAVYRGGTYMGRRLCQN